MIGGGETAPDAGAALVAARQAGFLLALETDGTVRCVPTPEGELLDVLRGQRNALAALLRLEALAAVHVVRIDPHNPEVTPDPLAEVEALAAGWEQLPDGSWLTPESW